MGLVDPHWHYFRDHGHVLRSTSVNLAFRIWRAILAWHAAMIMAGSRRRVRVGGIVRPRR
jgi:hypothetical protein